MLALALALADTDERCPDGDLLAGAPRTVGIKAPARLHNDIAGAEGDAWDGPTASIFVGLGASATWDLDGERTIGTITLQGDNNDAYVVEASGDGEQWSQIWRVPTARGGGLQTRSVHLDGVVARHLRLRPDAGDGSFSVAEISASCRADGAPAWTVEASGPRPSANDRLVRLAWWKLLFAGLGLGALLGVRHGKAMLPPAAPTAVRLLLTVVGIALWTNIWTFHGGRAVHLHDAFHYVVGAKYAPELGYDRLYACAALAEAEDPDLIELVQKRRIRNLRTNTIERRDDVLTDPFGCHEVFTDDRWAAFVADVTFFRKRMGPADWAQVFRDHGYNATPVWTRIGHTLADNGPITERRLRTLGRLDVYLYLGAFGLLGWAFGAETMALTAILFGVGYPWAYFWTGGSFGRVPWFFMAAACLALARRGMPVLAGFAATWSMLLRLFPGALLIGPFLVAGSAVFRRQSLPPVALRALLGALLGIAVLVPPSLVGLGDTTWSAFSANTRKHAGTPLTNDMGLPVLVAWEFSTRSEIVRRPHQDDPYADWKAARHDAADRRQGLRWILSFLALDLAAVVAIRRRDDLVVQLGVGLLLMGALVKLTSYYWLFFVLAAVLARRSSTMALVVGAAAATQVAHLGLTWFDERYAAATLVLLVALALLTWFVPASDDTPS